VSVFVQFFARACSVYGLRAVEKASKYKKIELLLVSTSDILEKQINFANAGKTEVIYFCRKTKMPTFNNVLFNSGILHMDCMIDIGIFLDSNLLFHQHADYFFFLFGL
jgi:stalled ribosome rescue protein Dom34